MLASRALTFCRVFPTAVLAFLALLKAADAPSATCTQTPASALLPAWLFGTIGTEKPRQLPAQHQPSALMRSSGPEPAAQRRLPTASEGSQIPSSGSWCHSAVQGRPAKIQKISGRQNGISIQTWRQWRLTVVTVAPSYLKVVNQGLQLGNSSQRIIIGNRHILEDGARLGVVLHGLFDGSTHSRETANGSISQCSAVIYLLIEP